MLRWFYFWMLVFSVNSKAKLDIPLNPGGKNVCMAEEKFNVTVQVSEGYQEQYRTTEWCLQVPPRCTKYKWRWATRQVPKIIEHRRQVTQCCSGYVANGAECKPYCKEQCRHGACALPNTCYCFPGFRGPLCQEICKKGTWGGNCQQTCECLNGSYCNPMNGNCVCTPGWRGKRCEHPCEEGHFGYECRRPCYCDEELTTAKPCHHITGECYYITTEVSETTSELWTGIGNGKFYGEFQALQSTPAPDILTTTVPSSTDSLSLLDETAYLLPTTVDLTTAITTELSTTSGVSPTTSEGIIEASDLSTLTSERITEAAIPTSSSSIEDTLPPTTESTTEILSSSMLSSSSVIPSESTMSQVVSTSTHEPRSTTDVEDRYQIDFSVTFPVSTERVTIAPPTLLPGRNSTIVDVIEQNEDASIRQNIAGLVVTIVLSIFGSVVLLIAAAGLALVRRRKKTVPPVTEETTTDIGLYRFYAEEAVPDILEAEYDHPPARSGTPTYYDHLYDEISNTVTSSTQPQVFPSSYSKYF